MISNIRLLQHSKAFLLSLTWALSSGLHCLFWPSMLGIIDFVLRSGGGSPQFVAFRNLVISGAMNHAFFWALYPCA